MDAQPTKDVTQIRSAKLSAREEWSVFLLMSYPPHSLITFGISSSKSVWILSLPSGCHNYSLITLWNINNSYRVRARSVQENEEFCEKSKDAHRKMSLDVRLQDVHAKALT